MSGHGATVINTMNWVLHRGSATTEVCCIAVLQAGRPGLGCGQVCFPKASLLSVYWLPFPCSLPGLSSLRASPLMLLCVLSASSHKHACLQIQLPSDVWRVESFRVRIRRQTSLSPPQGILQDWGSSCLAKRGVCHAPSQVTKMAA